MTGVAVIKSINECLIFFYASARSAHAVDQLHVLSCISILKVLALSNADSGACNQDNLAWSRCPSFHNSLSRVLAMVHTFGFVAFATFRVFGSFDTSLCVTSNLRRCGLDSTNHRRRGTDPSTIFAASNLKWGLANIPLSSPMLMANMQELCNKSSIFWKMGNAYKYVCL